MSELLMIEQRRGNGSGDAAHWILEGGRILPGVDDSRRMAEVRSGLVRHTGVRVEVADAGSEEIERTLSSLHEPDYLEALAGASEEPVVMPELTPPGLPPDIPVTAGLVAAAREAVRTAITAAERLLAGTRFTYALCRPPGHHAGPAWFAGYCYLNSAAAAAQTLREGGVKPVGILDIDLHYPNGTAAIVASMADASLHSLHASPVTNVAAQTVVPSTEREHVVEFAGSPDAETYLDAVATSIDVLAQTSAALVVSLGYDIVEGDPHGSWSFSPEIFTRIGRLLAASQRPVCTIQEGGYALDVLAECSHAFATGLLDGAASERGSDRACTSGSSRGSEARVIGATSGLEPFRRRLDPLDDEIARLFGERFEICREVARHKRAEGIPMMQPERVAEVRARYLARGAEAGLPADFSADLFELLIGATCKLEDELMEEPPAPGRQGA